MFDGIDPQLDSVVDRLMAVGMGGDLHAEAMGGVNHRLDLVIGHQLGLRVVPDRHDPTRRHDLNQVGALAPQKPDRLARLFRAVDHIGRTIGLEQFLIEPVQPVAMAVRRSKWPA